MSSKTKKQRESSAHTMRLTTAACVKVLFELESESACEFLLSGMQCVSHWTV